MTFFWPSFFFWYFWTICGHFFPTNNSQKIVIPEQGTPSFFPLWGFFLFSMFLALPGAGQVSEYFSQKNPPKRIDGFSDSESVPPCTPHHEAIAWREHLRAEDSPVSWGPLVVCAMCHQPTPLARGGCGGGGGDCGVVQKEGVEGNCKTTTDGFLADANCLTKRPNLTF